MIGIKYLLRDLYRYIFRYIPWVIIGFLLACFLPSLRVDAAAGYITPPDAALTCYQGTCRNWNTNATFNTAINKGISYRGLNFATRRDIDVVKYGYLNDALLSRYEYYDLNFTIQYTNAQTISVMPVKVNNYTCKGTIEGPYTDGSITTAPLVTYTCDGVKSNLGQYIWEVEFPISFKSGDTTTNFYVWISPLYYNESQFYQTNEKLDDINDSITNPNVDIGDFNDTDINNDNGVLSAILTLPIDFFQTLIDALSDYNSCPNLDFTLPFIDYDVTLPCIRTLFEKMNASQFWETAGLTAGGLLMFQYLIHLGKELSDMMTLKETRAEWGGL